MMNKITHAIISTVAFLCLLSISFSQDLVAESPKLNWNKEFLKLSGESSSIDDEKNKNVECLVRLSIASSLGYSYVVNFSKSNGQFFVSASMYEKLASDKGDTVYKKRMGGSWATDTVSIENIITILNSKEIKSLQKVSEEEWMAFAAAGGITYVLEYQDQNGIQIINFPNLDSIEGGFPLVNPVLEQRVIGLVKNCVSQILSVAGLNGDALKVN